MSNPQNGNVGNLGDILKHGALVAIAQQLLSQSSGKIAYIDTHTFRLSAPCPDPSHWHEDIHREKEGHGGYSEYLKFEQQIMDGKDYRCSSGLILDMLTNSKRPYTVFMCEKDPDTRQLLKTQLASENQKHYVMLNDAADIQLLQIPSDVKTLLMLVDPFELTRDLWIAVCKLLENCLSNNIEIIAEVFTYDKNTDNVQWPKAPGSIGNPRVVISRKPYHLAVYSTQHHSSLVIDVCRGLGWSLCA